MVDRLEALMPALVPIISRCRQDITWKKVGPKTICQRRVPLTKSILKEHLRGYIARGLCPILEGENTTRLAVLDLDSHNGETPWKGMVFAADSIIQRLEEIGGLGPVAFRSYGGEGIHIIILWKDPQDAYSVREFLKNVLEDLRFKVGVKGVGAGEVEVFPKQDSVEKGGAGSMFILPLAGKSVPLHPLLGYEPGTPKDALDIRWEMYAPVPVLTKPEPKAVAKVQHMDGDLGDLKKALLTIPSKTDYELWIKIGMALHAETGGSDEGLSLWEEWSLQCADYKGYEELQYKWNSFKTTKDKLITAGSIKKLASEHGWREDYSKDFEDVSHNEPVSEKKKKRKFKLIRADNYLKRPSVKWIIKGLVPEKSSGMAYGGSGDGKTFCMVDMACSIALGLPWSGRKVRRERIVYVCAEGAGGFMTRLAAYIKEHGINKKDLGDYLAILPAAPNFLNKEEVAVLAEEINAHYPTTGIVFIDTLAQTSTGGDENSAKDMNVMLHNVGVMRDLTGATSLLVHHTGKDESRGARGSTTLKADCDFQFHISREGDNRLFWVAKMKDGPDNFGWNFGLENVLLGADEDGDVVSSCVVKFDTNLVTAKKTKGRKHGYWEDLILKSWEALGGGNMTIDDVVDEAKRSAPQDSKKKDRRREHARRAIESLAKNGELTIRDDQIVIDLNAA